MHRTETKRPSQKEGSARKASRSRLHMPIFAQLISGILFVTTIAAVILPCSFAVFAALVVTSILL